MQEISERRIITLEEHYTDHEIIALYGAPATALSARLADFTTIRLEEMDEAGIDLQVLSHAPPGLQAVDGPGAPALARRANDRLRQVIAANPTRFAGFASLPTAVPEAAADELERAVVELKLRAASSTALRTDASLMISASGLSLPGRKRWACRSISILLTQCK